VGNIAVKRSGDDLLLSADAGIISVLSNARMATDKQMQFRDTAVNIASIDDGHLDLSADVSVDVNSPLLSTTGNITALGGTVTAGVDNTTRGYFVAYGPSAGAYGGTLRLGTKSGATLTHWDLYSYNEDWYFEDSAGNEYLGFEGGSWVIQSDRDGIVKVDVTNNSNNAAAGTRLDLLVASGAGGDVAVTMGIASTAFWSVGIDNSDSDKFKIHNAATLADTSLFEFATDGSMLISTGPIYIRDTAIYIASLADGYMDMVADTAIRMQTAGAGVTIGTASVNVHPLSVGSTPTYNSVPSYTFIVNNANTPARMLAFGYDNAIDAAFIQSLQSGATFDKELLLQPNAGRVGIGVLAVPKGGIGAAKLGIGGTDSSTDGPHVQFTTTSDSYPLFQILPYAHGGIFLAFDAYWDGGWKSSNAGSNFQIAANGNQLSFRYASGVAQGASLGAFTNNAFYIDASGNIHHSPAAALKTYWRDTDIYIASLADGYLDFVADTTFRFNGGNVFADNLITSRHGGSVVANGQHQITASDDTAQAAGTGGGIAFEGKYTDGGAYTTGAAVYMLKENGTSGEYGFHLGLASRDHGAQTAEVMRLTADGKVGIGTTTVPRGGVGAAKFGIHGTDASDSGPHVQFTTTADNFPVMQIRAHSHSLQNIYFNAYNASGATRSSGTAGNWVISHNAGSLYFQGDSGTAAGAVPSFATALRLDANGDIMHSLSNAYKTYWRDTAIYIASLADGYLDIVADTEIRLGKHTTLQGLSATQSHAIQFADTGGTEMWIQFDGGLAFGEVGVGTHMTIDEGGDVGIGITAPEANLHIYRNDAQTTTLGLIIEQDGTGDAALKFRLSGTENWVVGIDNDDGDSFKIADDQGLGSADRFEITTAGLTYIGNIAGGNYSEFEADGTLQFIGDATVWKDINIGSGFVQLPAASAPSITTFLDNVGADTDIATLQFAVGEKVGSTIELQHDYKEGSDFTFHIHFQCDAAPTGTDYVKWQIDYTIVRDGTTMSPVTSITIEVAVDTQYEQVRADWAASSGTGLQIGDQISFKLSRIAAVGDAYTGTAKLKTVGIHYEVDTVGSRTIGAK
jgi:hypothetical protein